jgi:hypothetical protein
MFVPETQKSGFNYLVNRKNLKREILLFNL